LFRKSVLIAFALLSPGLVRAQDAWRDTAHHRPGFVTVQRNVRLHYLDFGGSGPPLILLAGLGNTAHAWDDFAPAFTDRFHVVAITRRGFGESAHPNFGYDTPRLVADILAVMDSLKIPRASFIGHSIAGEEMTRLGAHHPGRVDRLVYLDGAYDRVRANILVGMDSVPEPEGEKVILPTGGDTLTAAAYVAYVHRSRGVNIPEADIRTRFRYDGWREELTTAYGAIDVETPEYEKVRAPSLAIYAVNDTSDELYSTLRAEFKRETPNGQVMEIRGAHHWIFVSHAKQVIDRARAFLLNR
jgi:pimeloyl-ACP methyl ester carboxylesterase